MATRLQAASFAIPRILYWYYPQLPVAWNPITSKLNVNYSTRGWLTWLYLLFNAFLVALGDLYVVTTHFKGKNRPNFGPTHIFLFVCGGAFVVTVCVMVGILMRCARDAEKGYNELFSLSHEMKRKFQPDNPLGASKALHPDMTGVLMCAIAFSLSAPTPIIVLFVVFGNFDVITFISADILPKETLCLTSTTLVLYLLRLWIVGGSVIEVFRSLAFFFPVLGFALMNFLDCITMLDKIEDPVTFLRYYLRLSANYRIIRGVLQDVTLVLISVAFWGTVGAMWVVVEGYGMMLPLFYGCFVGGVIMAIVITGLFVRIIRLGLSRQEGMMERRRMEAKELFKKRKTKHTKYVTKRMEALRIIQIWVGNFIPLTLQFAINYVDNLVERAVDLILMFDMKHFITI
ncbi:unnamed protein product [Orchesella dallaii]|uniref:Gustatory receptor n=1 Tax=Orchesella dallaii TaxID=48710 RepID=A0ABP1R658_9HEXA